MIEPVRIGIIGCGSVMNGPYMSIINHLRAQGLADVSIACDIREEKRQLVKDRHRIGQFSTNFEDVIGSDQVDLVLILTSMPEHSPIAQAALEAGKHVLVEKPMAVTLEEAAKLVETARTSPGYLVPAPFVILSPTYQAIHKHIHNGDVGKIRLARARYGWAGPWWGQWFYRSGGGPLFDLGVYNVASLTGLLGPAKRVTAMTGIAVPERVVDDEMIRVETEDNFQLLIDFGDATFAVVTTGFTMQKYRSPAIELYGSTGTIQMMGDDWHPEGYELWQNDVGAWKVFEDADSRWPWTYGLRHLVECIQQGVKPLVTPEHGYHVLEIMIKALEAGRDGETKRIESTFTPPSFVQEDGGTASHLVHDRSS
jgi:predicted dehydrogenase